MVKLLELFKGTGSVGKVAKKMGWQVISLDFDPYYTPDIETDILEWNYRDFQKKDNYVPDFIWASPPCNTFSTLSYQLKERDTKTGEPKSERAKTGTQILHRTLEIIQFFKKLNPNLKYVIENPRAMMRLDKRLQKEVPNRDTTLYCHYGYNWRKPTDFFNNIPNGLKLEPSEINCAGDVINVAKVPLDKRYSIPPKLVRAILERMAETKTMKGAGITSLKESLRELGVSEDDIEKYVRIYIEGFERVTGKPYMSKAQKVGASLAWAIGGPLMGALMLAAAPGAIGIPGATSAMATAGAIGLAGPVIAMLSLAADVDARPSRLQWEAAVVEQARLDIAAARRVADELEALTRERQAAALLDEARTLEEAAEAVFNRPYRPNPVEGVPDAPRQRRTAQRRTFGAPSLAPVTLPERVAVAADGLREGEAEGVAQRVAAVEQLNERGRRDAEIAAIRAARQQGGLPLPSFAAAIGDASRFQQAMRASLPERQATGQGRRRPRRGFRNFTN